ncbi:MAG: winged helix-turn-helix transcriptional regulator [Haloarculaceae archaeon]
MADLELESRREIYQTVRENPGIHFRALLDRLDYAKGTLQYHLRWLANADLVDVVEDDSYTRYYPAGEFDADERELLNAFRRTYSRRIIAHLLADGPLTTTELSDRIEKAKSTVSWHLSRLEERGLVAGERDGRAVRYSVTDPELARRLYAVHHRSFTDRIVDRLLGLWDAY